VLAAIANDQKARRTRGVSIAIGLASAACYLVLAHTDTRLNRMWFMVDLDVYRWSGTPVVSTTHLYTAKYSGFLSFTYTPFAAIVFAPLHLVNLRVLRWVSALANLAALFFSISVVTAHAGSESRVSSSARRNLCWLLFAVCVWMEPVQQTLRFGQVNLFLMVAVLADLARPEDSRWRGAFVGIAAGIKLTPAIFLLFLIVSGQRRDARRGVAAAAATVIVGWLLLPGASQAFWVEHRFAESSRVGSVQFVANQSIYGAIARVLGGRYAVPSVYLPLAATVLVLGMRQAVRLHRSGRAVPAICWCGFTGLLVSPISWSHHWVWAVPLVAWAATRAMERRAAALLAIGTAAAFAAWPMHGGSSAVMPFGFIWLTPRADRLGRTWGVPWITGNLYVLVALAAMVALEVWQRRGSARCAWATQRDVRLAAERSSLVAGLPRQAP
jgi:alpha-1,2-mannosyltransferase